LFDTNTLAVLFKRKQEVSEISARVTARGLRCAAPWHVFVEYLRLEQAWRCAGMAGQGVAGGSIDPRDREDQMKPLEFTSFNGVDALALLRWTVDTYPDEGDFGRLKLGIAIQASQVVFLRGLRTAGVIEGADCRAWLGVRALVEKMVAAKGSSKEVRKSVRRAAPLFREALEDEGLLAKDESGRWDELLAGVYRVCDGDPPSSLRNAFQCAPATVDWLTIGMALSRDLVIITSEKDREFKSVHDRCMDLDRLQTELTP
jgi:hypothetical protein